MPLPKLAWRETGAFAEGFGHVLRVREAAFRGDSFEREAGMGEELLDEGEFLPCDLLAGAAADEGLHTTLQHAA